MIKKTIIDRHGIGDCSRCPSAKWCKDMCSDMQINYNSLNQYLESEFKGIKLPDDFEQGCVKSIMQYVCYLVKPTRQFGGFDKGCANWQNCPGYRYKVKQQK